MMKRFLFAAALLFVLPHLHAQTLSSAACPQAGTISQPADCLTWSNASMAATQTNNANGQETSGPGTAEVWYCVGNGMQCGAPMLPQSGANDTVPQGSGWTLAGTVPQTSSGGAAVLLNLSFSALYQITVRDAWTAGGGYGPFPSTFLSSTMPAAPIKQPVAPSTPSGVVVAPTGI